MQEVPADKGLNGAADSLGAALGAAREARKLPLHKAAQDMHVGDEILTALERDDYRALGAPIFVRGHLRNYARVLGLSEDEVLAAYEHATSKPAPPPLITLRPSGGSALGRRFAMPVVSVAVIAVLVVLAVAWWRGYRPAGQPAVALTQANSTAVEKPLPAATTLLAPAVSTGTNEPGDETPTLPKPELTVAHRGVPVPKAAAKPVPNTRPSVLAAAHVVSPQATAPAEAVPSSQLMQVKFTVTQPSWIEVYDAAGKRLFYDLAPAGDNLNVSGTGPLQVFLGYAPGVSIELNGAPFNKAPFTRPDNTARFKLGPAIDNAGAAG
ncbi:MAG: RodZ domain-containing protein [Gammaproteobacteria bacterium]